MPVYCLFSCRLTPLQRLCLVFFIPSSFPWPLFPLFPLFPFFFLFSFFLLPLLPSWLTLCFINSLAFLVDLAVSRAVSDSLVSLPSAHFVNHCGAESPFALCFNAVTSLLFLPSSHLPTTIWSRLSISLLCEPIFTRLASPFRFLFSQFSPCFNSGRRRSVRSLESSPAPWLIYRVARSSRSLAKILSWVIGIMSPRSWVRVHTVLSGRYSQVLCLPSLRVEC